MSLPVNERIILDLCGGTGEWSKPYADAGYDVRNITLPDYDVQTYIPPENVYGILAAPPCPMFSFCRTNAKQPRDLKNAFNVVLACLKVIWDCQYKLAKDTQKHPPIRFWALENPIRGMLSWFLGKPCYVFNPYDFGDDYKKHTALWGWFKEPKKQPIKCSKPKFDHLTTKEICGEYYEKYNRQIRRSITPPGFAKAFFEANK